MALARRSFVKAGQNATNMGFAGGGFSDFLKEDNTRLYGLKKGASFEGKILPAFDLELPEEDTTYPSSTSPYRERVQDAAGQQAFTSWFARYYGYRFFRPYKNAKSYNFLSPINMAQYQAEDPRLFASYGYDDNYTFDPIHKMCEIARNQDIVQGWKPEYASVFTQDRSINEYGISSPRLWTLLNAFIVDSKNPTGKNVVMCLGTTATDHLLQQLNLTGPSRSFVTDDPDFFYLYEDVTRIDNPKYAFYPDTIIGANKQEASVISFGKSDRSLVGTRLFDFGKVTSASLDSILRARVDFLDIKQFDWWTVQRITDMLIEDGRVPLEFLEIVLQGRATISQSSIAAQNANRQYYDAASASAPPAQTATDAGQQAIMQNRGQTPPPPAAQVPNPAPQPAPAPVAEREFWVTKDGKTESMTENELKEASAKGFDWPVMLKTDSSWSTMEHYGLKAPAVAPAPATAPAPELAAPAPAPATPAPASIPPASEPRKRFNSGTPAKTPEQKADDMYGQGDDDIPFEAPKKQAEAASPASSEWYKDAEVDVTPEMEDRIKELFTKSQGTDADVTMTIEECAEYAQLCESSFGAGVVSPPEGWCRQHGLIA